MLMSMIGVHRHRIEMAMPDSVSLSDDPELQRMHAVAERLDMSEHELMKISRRMDRNA